MKFIDNLTRIDSSDILLMNLHMAPVKNQLLLSGCFPERFLDTKLYNVAFK